MRKTKIICTLGPSTDQEGVLEQLAKEGMDVARFNFSHGDYEEQKGRLDALKKIRQEMDLPIAALLDTKGPEIRLGVFREGEVELKEGQPFFLTTDDIEGTSEGVSVTYKGLCQDVTPGNSILIDDGLVELKAEQVEEKIIRCRVVNGGVISDHKSVNLPGVDVNMDFISEKDRADILFGIEQGFDYIAMSFTRTAADVKQVRDILQENGGESIRLIAKIENQQGVDHIDEIIQEADGVMIARGDMGVEIPLEDLPGIQKRLTNKVHEEGKPVITATQMLDSMIKNPRPTRAEATDVANAIYQGTSAIMLSGETASGKYPVEALQTMVKIALKTESDIPYNEDFTTRSRGDHQGMTNAISHATCMTSIDLQAAAIITVTKSGRTARMISKFRPACRIIGCTPDEQTYRQMNLYWGIQPVMIKEEYSMEILFLRATEAAEKKGYVKEGETVVLTAGSPLGKTGNTNLLKVSIVGEY